MNEIILRLKNGKDIKKVFQKGKSVATNRSVLYFLKNGQPWSRIAFSINRKKVKKSVSRNRIRRLYYELFRKKQGCWKNNYDFLFIVRTSEPAMTYLEAERDFKKLIQRAGI